MKIIKELKAELDQYPILWLVDGLALVWVVVAFLYCIEKALGL